MCGGGGQRGGTWGEGGPAMMAARVHRIEQVGRGGGGREGGGGAGYRRGKHSPLRTGVQQGPECGTACIRQVGAAAEERAGYRVGGSSHS